jgi:uncharacterized protein YbcI
VTFLRLSGGELNAAIADAAVRLHRRELGRGPTRAQVFFRDNVVVLVMRDAFTRAERALAEHGCENEALAVRQQYTQVLKADLVRAVEALTGATVQAFLCDGHMDPDVIVQVYLLDRSLYQPVAAAVMARTGAATAEVGA